MRGAFSGCLEGGSEKLGIEYINKNVEKQINILRGFK